MALNLSQPGEASPSIHKDLWVKPAYFLRSGISFSCPFIFWCRSLGTNKPDEFSRVKQLESVRPRTRQLVPWFLVQYSLHFTLPCFCEDRAPQGLINKPASPQRNWAGLHVNHAAPYNGRGPSKPQTKLITCSLTLTWDHEHTYTSQSTENNLFICCPQIDLEFHKAWGYISSQLYLQDLVQGLKYIWHFIKIIHLVNIWVNEPTNEWP